MRISLVRADYADEVIGKYLVAARQVHLRHVTTDAIRLRYRTRLHCLRIRMFGNHARAEFGASAVAREAFRVVTLGFLNDFYMGIVTRYATQTFVLPIEALTKREPIWLKAHVYRPYPMVAYYRFPRSVTLAAESRNLFR